MSQFRIKQQIFFFLSLFIFYFQPCWVFVTVWPFFPPLVRDHCGEQRLLSSCDVQASHCGDLSCCGAWASVAEAPRLYSTNLIVAEHGFSCFVVCGIFFDQESNPCLLHWQADSLPLSHQRSPNSRYSYASYCSLFFLLIQALVLHKLAHFFLYSAPPSNPVLGVPLYNQRLLTALLDKFSGHLLLLLHLSLHWKESRHSI